MLVPEAMQLLMALGATVKKGSVPAQTLAKIQYLAYVQLINTLTNDQLPLSIGDV